MADMKTVHEAISDIADQMRNRYGRSVKMSAHVVDHEEEDPTTTLVYDEGVLMLRRTTEGRTFVIGLNDSSLSLFDTEVILHALPSLIDLLERRRLCFDQRLDKCLSQASSLYQRFIDEVGLLLPDEERKRLDREVPDAEEYE